MQACRLGFIVLLVLLTSAAEALSLPRYAARYGQNCNLCHINPSGGGPRTLYASQFLVPQEMVVSTPSDEVMETLDPQIGSNVIVGADVRTMYVWSDEMAFQRNFFLMQGDLYLGFEMGEEFRFVLERGRSDTYEVYGVGQVLPWNGYVKVGRFTPDYGWKRGDHTAFTRAELGFFPPAHTDVGVEAGIFPGNASLTVSTWNGSPGRTLDTDDKLAAGARGALRMRLGSAQALLGATGRVIPGDAEDRYTGGAFGYLQWGRFAWVGEIDWDRLEADQMTDVTGLVHSHELSVDLTQGVQLLATYDFYDADIDLKTGSQKRHGGGVAAFLTPFVRLEARAQRYDVREALGIPDYWEATFQTHFLY